MSKLALFVFYCYSIALVHSQCGPQQRAVTDCFAENCAERNCTVRVNATADFSFEDVDNDAKLCEAFNTAICTTVGCCPACSEESRTFGQCSISASAQLLRDCSLDSCGANSGGASASQMMTATGMCLIASLLGLFGI